ncbi:MAG: 1-deoxy-D-xylulose-5-phosphate synthase, partial [Acidobacteria bacterium]|nr:1-deoxy-D-xylulose-5-phosphate synthase [Acidobacteriota bacterium]
PKVIEIGRAEIVREGADAAIIAYGSMVYPAIEAAQRLATDGIDATVVNARFVKPLDEKTILNLAREIPLIITVEEAYLAGGFGSAVLELLEANDLQNKVKIIRMGVPDQIVTHGDPKVLLGQFGLDAEGIYARVRGQLKAGENVNRKRLRIVG